MSDFKNEKAEIPALWPPKFEINWASECIMCNV